jgi:hypothetical protein
MNRVQLIEYLIKEHGLTTKDRSRHYIYKRSYLYHELRKLDFTLEDIGEMFGGKHYATVLHGIRQHEDLERIGYADYALATKQLKDFLDGAELPYYDFDIPNLKEDVIKAGTFAQFKRIQRHLKLGKYDEPTLIPNLEEKLGIYEKTSTFVGDRAADTSQANQEPGEGGLLCAQIIGNQQAGNS